MIEIKDLVYEYMTDEQENKVAALDGVSLKIEDGEFVCIVGHNGSGKSTLAKHLNGLLQPTSGDVLIDNMNTKDESKLLDIRQKIGIVFQNPDNQIVTTVVEEDVAFGPENIGIESGEIRRRVDESLKLVGMEKYAKNAPHMLSGGQKQRIAIAGMLAIEPDILVLDEATAMLDPIGRKEVLNIVSELNKKKHMTVIMITQYMEEAVHASRLIVMCKGKVMMDGETREIFKHGAQLRELSLDVPDIVALRDELILNGVKISNNAITETELAEELCR